MRHLQKEGGVLSSLNQTINLFLPTISGLGAGTFFFIIIIPTTSTYC